MERTVKDCIKIRGLKVKIVKIGKFREDELDSSSKIKQKIIEHFER
jgi:glycerol-3-phosphate cytidylyltransferase-like family protein